MKHLPILLLTAALLMNCSHGKGKADSVPADACDTIESENTKTLITPVDVESNNMEDMSLGLIILSDSIPQNDTPDNLPNTTNSWGDADNSNWVFSQLRSDTLPDFDLSAYHLRKADEDSVRRTLAEAWFNTNPWFEMSYIRKHSDCWKYLWRISHIYTDANEDCHQICRDVILKMYLCQKHPNLKEEITMTYLDSLKQIIDNELSFAGDGANMDMMFADSQDRCWKKYMLWKTQFLFDKELKALHINYKSEDKKLQDLFMALHNCYDSIYPSLGDSGYWAGYSQLDGERMRFMDDLLKICLDDTIIIANEMPLSLIDDELQLVIKYHEPDTIRNKEDYEIAPIVNRYKVALHRWYNYRCKVAQTIQNPTLRFNYIASTNTYLREQLIHIKNRFKDVGFMSGEFRANLLHNDCTYQELINYSYEEAFSGEWWEKF